MVTMLDVSRKAGVSTATVSRVINKPEIVDEKTRLTVQKAISTLDYRPNLFARGLAGRSSHTIGIAVNGFSSPYFGLVIDGMEQALARVGYKTIAESNRRGAEGEREAWLSLIERRCEGVIIHSANLSDEELKHLMQQHPSSVLINRLLPDFEHRCINLDNFHAAEIAAKHLIDNGHREIAVITGPKRNFEVKDRINGFNFTLNNAGLKLDKDLTIEADFSGLSGQEGLEKLLATGKKFTAVFFHNDEMAAGGMETCRKANIRIPEDISIIGFDDVAIAKHLTPKLTTVRQPLREIGATAGLLARAIANNPNDADHLPRTFQAEVVERASVARI